MQDEVMMENLKSTVSYRRCKDGGIDMALKTLDDWNPDFYGEIDMLLKWAEDGRDEAERILTEMRSSDSEYVPDEFVRGKEVFGCPCVYMDHLRLFLSGMCDMDGGQLWDVRFWNLPEMKSHFVFFNRGFSGVTVSEAVEKFSQAMDVLVGWLKEMGGDDDQTGRD